MADYNKNISVQFVEIKKVNLSKKKNKKVFYQI